MAKRRTNEWLRKQSVKTITNAAGMSRAVPSRYGTGFVRWLKKGFTKKGG